jgi:HK97 family phage prohead protease
MAITVNSKGVAHARSLISAGKINEGAWSFSGADGNALLGDDDWAEYGKWFLAVDSDADAETKDHYKYPFGKGGEIYRRGVIAAKSRAAQQNLTAVSDAADSLLEAIDKKLGKEEDSFQDIERRFRPFAGSMRAAGGDDGAMIIEGYPIVYEQYAPLWGFREIIRKGAATEALKRSDELVLWDHETSQPMARRSAGTLEAKEDDNGVFIRADVSKTVWGRDGYEAIAAEVINRMSFAFDTKKDNWFWEEIAGVKIETREILSFETLYDYSPVSYPAYKETVVMARCKDLALRHRPEPGAPGDGSRALRMKMLQLQGISNDLDPYSYLNERRT